MEERTLEWLELLARALLIGAALVIVLGLVGAVAIAGSENTVAGVDVLQRQNRGLIAIGAFGASVVGGGLLAGLGAILRLLIAERRERAPVAEPPPDAGG